MSPWIRQPGSAVSGSAGESRGANGGAWLRGRSDIRPVGPSEGQPRLGHRRREAGAEGSGGVVPQRKGSLFYFEKCNNSTSVNSGEKPNGKRHCKEAV